MASTSTPDDLEAFREAASDHGDRGDTFQCRFASRLVAGPYVKAGGPQSSVTEMCRIGFATPARPTRFHARMPRKPPRDIRTLDQALDSAWCELVAGVGRREHPFHQGVLATATPEGPEARYVVPRRCDRERGELWFHTDRRSPKLAQLWRAPQVAWCFHGNQVQVRLAGRAEVLTEGEPVDTAWQRLGLLSRRCYLVPAAPGSELDSPARTIQSLEVAPPTPEQSERGRPNFCVVRVAVTGIDWLHLDHRGHQRAQFVRMNGGWRGSWRAP